MPRPNSRDPEDDPAAFLGGQLKRVRLAANFTTQDALAKAMGFVREVVSKSETGERAPTDEVFAKWLDVCEVSDETREILAGLLTLARKADGPIPEWFERYLRAETDADFLRLWSFVAVPGLLQVREYAHAMYTLAGLDDDEAAAKSAARLARQSALEGPDPAQVTAIIHESVLHRLVGTAAIMMTQLTYLPEISQRRNVLIQVVRDEGYFSGLEGPWVGVGLAVAGIGGTLFGAVATAGVLGTSASEAVGAWSMAGGLFTGELGLAGSIIGQIC